MNNPDVARGAKSFRGSSVALMRRILWELLAPGFDGCSTPDSVVPSSEVRSTWWEAWPGGVDFRHESAPAGTYQDHRVIGSGVAVLDVDQDERRNVCCVTNAGPESSSTHRLFAQQPFGRLIDATRERGLATGGWGQGVVAGGIDNDGRMDLCVIETDRINPGGSFEAHRNLGLVPLAQRRKSQVLSELRFALQLRPDRAPLAELIARMEGTEDPAAIEPWDETDTAGPAGR